MLAPFFSRSAQISARDNVERIAAGIVASLADRRDFDLAELAGKFPLLVACEWLGLEENAAVELQSVPVLTLEWKNIQPVLRDGLIRDLHRTGGFTEIQLAELTGFFLLAGISTARDFVGFAVHTLLRQREVLSALTSGEMPVPAFTDELLRFEPPVHSLSRVASCDVSLGGSEINAGASVWISLASANRDPAIFSDPDEFIPGRAPSQHLSFGAGPHACLGSHLGRLEGEVMLSALLPHLERLRSVGKFPRISFGGISNGLPSMRRMSHWSLTFQPA
jgi:cytochrome P450